MTNDCRSCICLFASLYHPSIGGVETYTASLARELARRGLRVIVVACNTHGQPSHEEEPSGVEVLRLPCLPLLNTRFPLPFLARASKEWKWLCAQRIDYVVVNSRFYPLSIMALRFAREKGIAPILIEHGSAHLTLGNRYVDIAVRKVEHHLTEKGKRFDPVYYAVSRKASEWLGHFGIASLGEIHNAIDADAYAAGASDRDFREELGLLPDTLLVSFVGRIVPEKGVRQLAEASRILSGGIFIAMAGTGPYLQELRYLERNDVFRLLGRLSRQDAAALLAQSDVMCLPSRSEGFATTLLEAAACKTPPLVTSVGGTDELVPSEDYGTILPEATPQAIAKALRNLRWRRDALTNQGERIHHLVKERFSWESTALATLEACRRAQENAQPPR
ncbi:MAG: glycosyltransferase family 4 protein [Eggerthellaceae bacterium]